MLVVLTALFTVALLAPILFARMGRSAFYVLAAAPAAAFIWLIFTFSRYTQADQSALAGSPNAPPSLLQEWVPEFKLNLDFRMDDLTAVLSLLVLGVGALVLFYCARYFKKDAAGLGAFGSQLLAFAAAMFGLVTADNLLLLYIFWEITTVLSYLLIGYARHRLSARRAALQALIVTTFGGLAMLVGFIMIGESAGTYRISEILADTSGLLAQGTFVDIAVALVLLGAMTKSAQVPFHFWLPAAMAAPTPVSAYLHAAAMVKAGIYLVARFAPGFSETAFWDPIIIVLGLATMIIGGWRALRQFDLKLLLAYGTVSQLGFLMLVVGVGNREAALAGLGLLLAHGLFKATLFLVVGIIDHRAGTRDLRELSGLRRKAPWLATIAVIGAASMAGLPPLLGFVAKESVYDAFVQGVEHDGGWVSWTVLIGVVLGSVLTFAYSARFVWGGFATKDPTEDTPFSRIELEFLAAPAILAAATVALGLWAAPVDLVVQPYLELFPDPGTKGPHLALWHGITPALGLTVVTIGLGVLLFWQRGRMERLQLRMQRVPEAERLYRGIIGLLDDVAIWVTGRTQRGSLAFYLTVILGMALITPLLSIFGHGLQLPLQWHWFDGPLQAAVGAGVILGGLGAIRANKRFLAVLMVSVTGYGMALLFVLQGAPDLALTQMLVETVVLVAFVLALRSLPSRLWETQPGKHRVLRAVLGVSFGLTMMFIAASAMGARVAAPVSLTFPGLAHDGGGGDNIVNVTLVDIRAWDTFGEISVLAIAATGVASLIFVRSRGDKRLRSDGIKSGSVDRDREKNLEGSSHGAALGLAEKFNTVTRNSWLVAGRTLAPERRSIIFEVVTRLIFHSVIVFSIFLLLSGHNSPGGGFAGGLMAGLALAIRYLAGGRFELAEATPVSAGALLGSGLGLASLTALAPLALGGQVFQSAILKFSMPLFGDVKFVTATFFDIGVYLVVVGLVLDVLRSLGSEVDERTETGAEDNAEDYPDGPSMAATGAKDGNANER